MAGCKSATGCVDALVPVRSTYVNLRRWAESDADFVRLVIEEERNPRKRGPSPRLVDSYSCRQMYLRSYTFSRKESMPEKTRKCLGRAKKRAAAEFPYIVHGKRDDSSSMKSKRRNSARSKSKDESDNKRRRKKGCVTAKKLTEASCSAIRSIFYRLLLCTTSVDVVDDRRSS